MGEVGASVQPVINTNRERMAGLMGGVLFRVRAISCIIVCCEACSQWVGLG